MDVSGLANAVRDGIDPQVTVPKSVTQRLSLPGDLGDLGAAGGDTLQPLAFTPSFPQPFFETIRDGALPWLIPGLSSFPDEAITVLGADTAVIEAILAGANHELSRELLWRGVPALHTATFFARFWDRRDATGNPLPDITSISAWPADSDLGSHAPAAVGELAVLVWHGELVRRFPHATIYAAPAVPVQSSTGASSRTIDLTQRIDPLFSGSLGGDPAFAGFPFTVQDAMGGPESPGKYFTVCTPPVDLKPGRTHHDRSTTRQPRQPRPPTRREQITAIITGQPPRDWSGHELAILLGVKPRNMLTQLGEWARLGFFTRTGFGTYALSTLAAKTPSTTAPDP
ncbi:MAG TPA: hypothetical protein VGS19_17755 [Streptosporangiaceae bacterium]|nr:hypothetical protein [Streptosporangiaceae bacterium]